MTDPLGQSQVLPYIIGLSGKGYQFTLLSSEKPDRYAQYSGIIKEICDRNQIEWITVPFTEFPPFISKIRDLKIMTNKAIELCKNHDYSMVHCRSYIAADIGVKLKKQFGIKFLFDMRGFWVDERVEGGMWNLNNPLLRMAYKFFKKKEASYISHSDQIISLTKAGKKEIETWKAYRQNPITVIPCAADFNLFTFVTEEEKRTSKVKAGFRTDDFVVSYLGSIGTWYLLDEMLAFFSALKKKKQNAKFLFITPDDKNLIINKLEKLNLDKGDFKIVFAKRNEVRSWIASSDVSLSFIKQSYSKIASSPTKLGELLAMGIPVICNSKVGDVNEIIEFTKGGLVIDGFTESEYFNALERMDEFLNRDHKEIRKLASEYYDLQDAVEEYKKCYFKLLT